MLRLKNLIDALRLDRAMGNRPFSQYDVDDSHAIGPSVHPHRPNAHAPVELLPSEADSAAVAYERFEDPRTGEVLYRPKR